MKHFDESGMNYIAAQSDTLPNRLIDESNVVKNTNAAIDGLFGIIESLRKVRPGDEVPTSTSWVWSPKKTMVKSKSLILLSL
jgi:hypothetical protein